MSTLRLKSVRNQARKMLILDGVPLGCDGLFHDPALVILAESAARKFSHIEQCSDGAWLFPTSLADEARKAVADEISAYKAAEAKRDNKNERVRLHLAGLPFEEWASVTKRGKLITYAHRSLAGLERRVRTFKAPGDVKVGQPVLLRVRPHGAHCGCEPMYCAMGNQ